MGNPGGISGGLTCAGGQGVRGSRVCTGGWVSGGIRGADEHRRGWGRDRCRSRVGDCTWCSCSVQAGVRGVPGRAPSWDGMGCRGGCGTAQGLTAPPGSWVELRCGPGCPEPELAPSPFSCHADVEQMLLEAQLETESSDG